MTIHNDILMRLPNWVSTQSKYMYVCTKVYALRNDSKCMNDTNNKSTRTTARKSFIHLIV